MGEDNNIKDNNIQDSNILDKDVQKELTQNEHVSTSVALDDEQRVKVLSPSALVAKRFLRNRLAMIGLIILVTMFIFSFLGGMLTPYGESEVFRKRDVILKDYALMSQNKDFLYTNAEGKNFPSIAGAKMILAINDGKTTFESKDVIYSLIEEDKDLYQITELTPVANVLTMKGKSSFTPAEEGGSVPGAVKNGYEAALAAGEDSFEIEGTLYYIVKEGKQSAISVMDRTALASKKVFSAAGGVELSYDFKLNAEKAFNAKSSSFTVDGSTYELEVEENTGFISLDGEEYAILSTYAVRPVGNEALSLHFIQVVQEAVLAKDTNIEYALDDGSTIDYKIEVKGNEYKIRSEQITQLNDSFAEPNEEHLLGTDGNGMDVLTRLMYGGRISLMIGFVAIAIEILIGIVVGGIAGYFGKWMDTILMRVVDIVICIPAMPLYIIVGSIMDYYRIDPRIRIYLLCAILGLVNWPPIARMVRGQILSFREQEFMTATEATGIRVSRRIFKHLIPNVIPNLIVIATMGLGEVILMEATLSFLGIGVKFPYASWGNIISSVNDIFVMTNYWFVWIPAGLLILITVLGFNFVGDGLRDAFDPKMKR
ncbi:ABC transporter permease [Kineothrix sp. MB12-C1]|uniref:ABC transporter permease n=1 Tax=Kineothrix sp. MB12-C1 TaxID=3070215 RepID=UPI0027D2CB7C|nr:ABC transporter permease [Kineothrix sp. MB12-C1]WMC94268.1 ABC transporter permease [Kineothrix sp. MB12-C1]